MQLWSTLQDLVVGLTFSWIVWVIFSTLRRYLVSKQQSAVQQTIFERIDSSQALIELAASDSGRLFLESLTLERSEPVSPIGRILRGLQIGIVLTFFGISLLLLHHHTHDDGEGFMILGTGAIGLGIGFIVAAAASIWFSRLHGLLDREPRG
jgi:hypothetical protein